MFVYCPVVIIAETMDRDLEQEELLGDIIRDGGDVLSFSTTLMVRKERMTAPVIEQWRRKDMLMTAPVTEWQRKKETMMTAPVTKRRRELLQSPERYIY